MISYSSHLKFQKTTLEQISSIEEFINCIDSIELPNQLSSIFNNRYLQHFINLQPNCK
jgi:hypothetical protein